MAICIVLRHDRVLFCLHLTPTCHMGVSQDRGFPKMANNSAWRNLTYHATPNAEKQNWSPDHVEAAPHLLQSFRAWAIRMLSKRGVLGNHPFRLIPKPDIFWESPATPPPCICLCFGVGSWVEVLLLSAYIYIYICILFFLTNKKQTLIFFVGKDGLYSLIAILGVDGSWSPPRRVRTSGRELLGAVLTGLARWGQQANRSADRWDFAPTNLPIRSELTWYS